MFSSKKYLLMYFFIKNMFNKNKLEDTIINEIIHDLEYEEHYKC